MYVMCSWDLSLEINEFCQLYLISYNPHLFLFLVWQAEEEFYKAQAVFEELNKELREDLPVIYNR